MKTLRCLAAIAAAAWCASAATHIRDTKTMNDGVTPMAGFIYVTGPTGSATTPSVPVKITLGKSNITGLAIEAGGVDINLVGCVACSYQAKYDLRDAQGRPVATWEERWIVPATSSVLSVKAIQGGGGPPYYQISVDQLNPNRCSPGQTFVWDGAAWKCEFPALSNGGVFGVNTWDQIEHGIAGGSASSGGSSVVEATDAPLKGDGAGNAVAATASDITGLFSGGGQYLRADGTTGTPSGSGASLPNTTGVLKGDGAGGAVAAVAGTDYVGTSDARLTDARTPTAHKTTHATGGTDALTPADIAAEPFLGNPLTDGRILSSTAGGNRTWIPFPTVFYSGVTSDGANGLNVTGSVAVGSRVVAQGSDSYVDPLLAGKAPATSGTAPLKANGSGGFANATAADVAGLFAGNGQYLRADGTTGTPSGGTGASLPSITNILKGDGNGGATAAVAGTDFVATDDSRLTNARTPTAHASTHGNGQADAITIAESQVTNLATDLAAKVGTSDSRLSDARTPTAHASSHLSNGGDPIGAASTTVRGTVTTTTANSQAASTDDPRMSNARTPTTHASTHQNGGGDEVGTATPSANAIPKADGTGKLASGWFPTLNQNTTGTAANLSGTPALPNGTTATTQAAADNSTKLATTAYVDSGLAGKQASGSYVSTVQQSGVAVTQRPTVNFTGAGVNCTDNSGANRTDCAITSGSGSGDASTNTSTSVNGEAAVFSGTGGKTLARATGTGIAKLTSGVLGTAVAADFPALNQNTTGTAANLSGTPALPNGTTATTQTAGDNTTKLATTAYVDSGLSSKASTTYVDTGLAGKAASNASTAVNGQTCALGGSCTVNLSTGDTTHSAAILWSGVTSGGVAFAVADVAGTLTTLVLPTDTNTTANGGVFTIGGTVTCPTLAAGIPTTCRSASWTALPVVPANTGSTLHQYFTAYNSTTGAYTKAQPACSDLSDAGTGCSGTLPAAYGGTPAMNGTAAAGTSTNFSRGDHVHPTDTTRAASNATATVNGVTVTLGGSATIPAVATVADEGVGLTQRPTINFSGAGVSCVDNAGATRTDCTISGGTGTGDASTNTSTSVDSEVAVFSGTGGKTLKRATGSGLAKLTSGVLSTAAAGTDYVAPNGNITGTAAGLSGTPALPNGTTATTQAGQDNSTKLATTAYVDAGLANKAAVATVQDEGTGLTQRTIINFVGAGVSCADNAGSSRTDCTINGGGGTSVASVAVASTDTSTTIPYGQTIGDAAIAYPNCITTAGQGVLWDHYIGSTTQMVVYWSPNAGFTGKCGVVLGGTPGATGAPGGDASTNTSTSVDSEVVLFSGTAGKTLKRATGSGVAKLTSGVLGTAAAGTDYVAPGGALGTPSSGTLTNATGLPISTGVSGLGTGVATFLGTASSANLRAALTDESGTGAAYFQGGDAGTPSAITLTNATGLPAGAVPAVTVAVGTSTPVTVSTTLNAAYYYNQHATAATAITYNLPTAAAGKQFCVSNSYNGSAANTGALTLQVSATGQYIIFTDGTLSASNGYVVSGGAAADAACVVGVDSTHWMLYVQRGTWTKH